jgi:hypothetical protein
MLKYAIYQNAAPYFDLVRGALGDLVDGKHFFDIVTDDIIYEVLYDIPGWPRVIKGRSDLMAAFRGYVDNIALRSARRSDFAQDGRRPGRRYRIPGSWDSHRDRRKIRQPVLFDH